MVLRIERVNTARLRGPKKDLRVYARSKRAL